MIDVIHTSIGSVTISNSIGPSLTKNLISNVCKIPFEAFVSFQDALIVIRSSFYVASVT